MKNQKTLLISLDAISNLDFATMQTLPNFSKLISKGSYCNTVTSVYPSLTFPAHASVITGCYPKHHGIVNNHIFDPLAAIPVWYHYDSALKRKALWDYFEEQNQKVLALSWPVSAGGNISYSLPEMSPAKPKKWGPVNFFRQVALWFNFGSKNLMLKAMLTSPSFTRAWFFGEQPQLDKMMITLLKKTMPKYQYNLLLFHIYGMDDAKHEYGILSKEAESFLSIYDQLLGDLIDFVDEENNSDRPTTLMVMGDHSQKDVSHGVYLNHMIKDLGFCQTDGDTLVSWKAQFHSGDGMAYLYVNAGEDEQAIASAVSQKLRGNTAIGRVFEKSELAGLGCDENAVLALDAVDDYMIVDTFLNAPLGEDCIGPPTYRAVHGYLPFPEDYRTLFFAYGNGILTKRIDEMSILDIAPTICKLQDIDDFEMDGNPIEDILL